MKNSLIFFGSGPVAAKSLELLTKNFDVEAVITKPSTKHQMIAAGQGARVHTVSTRKELDALIVEQTFDSQLGVLIDFGIIVSKDTIDSFSLGIINSHFSMLPALRGADPITFSILEGRQSTGVSLMILVPAMDEGPLLVRKPCLITPADSTPTLTDKLISLSDELLTENIPLYMDGALKSHSQDIQSEETTYTRKLLKADGIIDWSKPASTIALEVRAYSGWPRSRTKLNGIDVAVLESSALDAQGEPGSLFIHGKKLAVFCGKNSLIIDQILPAGKKPMDSQSFLAGYKTRLDLN